MNSMCTTNSRVPAILGTCTAIIVFALSTLCFGQQGNLKVTITSDNAYMFGVGTVNGIDAGSFYGGVRNGAAADIYGGAVWDVQQHGGMLPPYGVLPSYGAERYTISDDIQGKYIYIIAWSDNQSYQGTIARFEDVLTQLSYLTGPGSAWEVYATGLDYDSRFETMPTLQIINAQIALANAKSGVAPGSIGWVNELGCADGGSGCRGRLLYCESFTNARFTASPGLQQALGDAVFMWYGNPDYPNGDCDISVSPASSSGEFLIFRLGPLENVLSDPCELIECATNALDISTGLGSAPGGIDTQWELTAVPGNASSQVVPRPAFIIDNHPAWYPYQGSSAAEWISANQHADWTPNNPNEPYIFRYRFCVCRDDKVVLNMRYWVDNSAVVKLDGTVISTTSLTSTANFQQGSSVNYSFPVLAGEEHLLTIEVKNQTGVAMGLMVEGTLAGTTPGTQAFIKHSCCNPSSSIIGRKMHDVGCDGIQASTIAIGIAGWEITLNGPGGTQTTTTDALGYYFFGDLPPGQYTVTETPQATFTASNPASGSHTVTISENQVVQLDFLNCADMRQYGSICGVKINDLNGDGQRGGPGESGLGGWVITGNGGLYNITNNDGSFCWTLLPPGTYTICEQQQEGWSATGPLCHTVTLAAGQTEFVEFFNQPATQGCIEVIPLEYDSSGVSPGGQPMHPISIAVTNPNATPTLVWFESFQGSVTPTTIVVGPGSSFESISFIDTPPYNSDVCIRYGVFVNGQRQVCDSICFNTKPDCVDVTQFVADMTGVDPNTGNNLYNVSMTVNNPSSMYVVMWLESQSGTTTPDNVLVAPGSSIHAVQFQQTSTQPGQACLYYGVYISGSLVLCDSLCFGLNDPCDDPECETNALNIATGLNAMPGDLDGQWELIAVPDNAASQSVPRSAFVIDNHPAWYPYQGSSSAQWISANQHPDWTPNNPTTPYVFRYRFCVCRNDRVTLSMLYWVDNSTVVRLNGVEISSTTLNSTSNFQAGTALQYSFPVQAGIDQILTIEVKNQSGVAMGLMVEGTLTGSDANNPTFITHECCNPRSSIMGRKIHDVGCDGVEASTIGNGLPGWEITLTGPGGAQSATTDALGYYFFDNLLPGSYTVTETMQPNFTASVPQSGIHNVVLGGHQSVQRDFLNCADMRYFGSICGSKFNDADGDGKRGPNEEGIAGWVITGTGGLYNVTAADGTFCWSLLPPGTYTICEVEQDGWTATGPLCYTVTLAHGQTVTLEFGNKPTPTSSQRCCDTVDVLPYIVPGRSVSARNFTIHNVKEPPSAVAWIDVLANPSFPSQCTVAGGGLLVDQIPLVWGSSISRIPESGILPTPTAGSNTVIAFNIIIDNPCTWQGDVTFVVHHADGEECVYTYHNWRMKIPDGVHSVDVLLPPPSTYLGRMQVRNTDTQQPMEYLSFEIKDAKSGDAVLAGTSGARNGWEPSANVHPISLYQQGRICALFRLQEPLPVGATSAPLFIVVQRDSGDTEGPELLWTTYDHNCNALTTGTIKLQDKVNGLPPGVGRSNPGTFEILGSYPDPANSTATVLINLGSRSEVSLAVYSLLGEKIATVFRGVCDAGVQSIAAGTSGLATGSYYFQMESADKKHTRSFRIVR